MSTVMSFTVLERNWNSESKPDPFLGVSPSPFLQANGGTRLRGIFFHRPDPNVTGRCIWSWAGPRPRQNWGSLGRQGWLGTISFQNRTNLVFGPFGTSGCAYGGIMFFFNKNGGTPWGAPHPPLWAYRPEAANRISQLKNWCWSNDQRINPPRPAEEGSSFQNKWCFDQMCVIWICQNLDVQKTTLDPYMKLRSISGPKKSCSAAQHRNTFVSPPPP